MIVVVEQRRGSILINYCSLVLREACYLSCCSALVLTRTVGLILIVLADSENNVRDLPYLK
jgi:hypothetical protein